TAENHRIAVGKAGFAAASVPARAAQGGEQCADVLVVLGGLRQGRRQGRGVGRAGLAVAGETVLGEHGVDTALVVRAQVADRVARRVEPAHQAGHRTLVQAEAVGEFLHAQLPPGGGVQQFERAVFRQAQAVAALHGGGEGALDPGVQAQQAVPQFDVLGRGHGAGLRHGTPSGNDGRWNVRPRTGLTRVYMYMHAYLRQQEVAYTYKYCEECPVPWIYLLVASVFEVVFALATNATEGFTKLGP